MYLYQQNVIEILVGNACVNSTDNHVWRLNLSHPGAHPESFMGGGGGPGV